MAKLCWTSSSAWFSDTSLHPAFSGHLFPPHGSRLSPWHSLQMRSVLACQQTYFVNAALLLTNHPGNHSSQSTSLPRATAAGGFGGQRANTPLGVWSQVGPEKHAHSLTPQ